MITGNPGFAEALTDLSESRKDRRRVVTALLAPLSAAVTKRGKPVYEPAAAVARAVAVADALQAVLTTEGEAALKELLAEYEAEEGDE